MASWTNLPQFQVQTSTSIGRMDQVLENIIVSSSHSHTGADGQGASVLGIYTLGNNALHVAPGYEFAFHPFLPACLSNWNRVVACPGYINGGILKTATAVSASGACVAFPVPAFGQSPTGGWTLRVAFFKDANSGCVATCINGSPLNYSGGSTINLYSATVASALVAYDNFTTLSASGVVGLKFQVSGKDGSSGGYHAGISHIALTYT